MYKSFAVFFLIIFIFTVLMYCYQRSLMYYPAKQSVDPKLYNAADANVIKLTTKDNIKLTAWYFPAQESQATIVLFHGNAGHIGYRMGMVNALKQYGFGILLVSYRGFADSEGTPSEQGLYADGRAALDWLKQQKVNPQCTVLLGESLGTGVVTKLAMEYQVAAVVLQSPYTSMDDLAKIHYPWIVGFKPWDKYNSYSRIDSINAPLLIYHGQQDKVVPLSLGQKLYDKAKQPKQLIILEDKGHNDVLSHSLIDKVANFINQHSQNCAQIRGD